MALNTKAKFDTNGLANCRGWNAHDRLGETAFVTGYSEGMLMGATMAAKANKQIADHVTANKLNMGEVQGKVDTYCRDTTHLDKTLVEAIQHIADDFDKP